jgi:acyl carrier protein
MTTTISTEQVEARVIELIRSFVDDPTVEVAPQSTFEALDVDSLDLAELAQVVEEEYGVVLKGDDMKNLQTVGSAIRLIAARLP